MESVTLIHDDSGGDINECLTVSQGPDGDMWVRTGISGPMLRFRNWFGGGRYPRTHFALKLLNEAMAQDEADLKSGQCHMTAWREAAEAHSNE